MRFVVRFMLWLLLLASLGLLVLYSLTSYSALAALCKEINYGLDTGMVILPLTPARYAALRVGLGVVGAVSLGLLLGSGLRRMPPQQRARRAWWLPGAWLHPLLRLGQGERWLAGGLLLAAAGVHLWFALSYPLTLDEIASYDYSVLPGAALTASYYPFPNNHLLPNLLVGLVHQLLPGAGALVALRLLPTLLGLALLPLGYALLLRNLRFVAATLGWGLFSLSPLPVFYAVAGRGYGWALAALLAGLWASLELLRPAGLGRAGRQRAWAVFGLSAVVGLYAVPTHLYGLLGLGLSLLVGFARWPRRRWLSLLHLAAMAAGVGLVVAVLYAPVVAVSGWPALVANPYVTRVPLPEFWAKVGPYYLLGTASELLGRREVSAAVFGLLAVLGPVALRWGKLPEGARRLGWLAYAQLVLWLPLLLAQRVYAPARTLLAVLLFLFVVGGVVLQAAASRLRPAFTARPTTPAGLLALALVLGGYGAYRLHREQAIMAQQQQTQVLLRRSYTWLQSRQPSRVWIRDSERAYAIFWHHYALDAGQRPLPLVLREAGPAGHSISAGPGPQYEVLPVRPAGRTAVYADAQLVLVPTTPTAH